ncbi:MAG: 50S ribosomal protein L3 [Deltaproteobacteria bacterium]|nr:MAG: 50S ribosomal protein L3 [Deltaproteobacteria bacterium]
MANERPGLIGRKIGMTQLFSDDGTATAVTVIEAGPNAVIQVKTADGPDRYNAVQLGFEDKKPSRTTRPEQGHFDKAGVTPKKHVVEFRLSEDAVKGYTPGQSVGVADVFTEGDLVDVSGTSKGRGFAGVMKRHGFRGFIRTHGTHEYFRHGGSIGTRLTPGHVLKGKKMSGHMGAERVTVQNLKVVKVDAEHNLLFLKGGVPGPNGGIVRVRKAVKA